MALHIPKAPGFMSMLKDGARYFEGLEEAVFRNIEACSALSKTTKSTYGPAGQNKIVINHIGRQFVTNDAATILKELEVAHPAAKIMVLATQQQEQEAGDGTNIVFQFAGSFLEQARDMFKMGSGVNSTRIVKGMVFRRETQGDVKEVHDCKIAIYSCPVDSLQTETKGTVLLTSADELTNFSKGEENLMEKHMQAISDAGVKIIVSGGKVGELALHYANKLGIMVVRLSSKFDIRRLCQATGAVALPRLTAPTAEELGHVTHVRSDEIADASVVIFEQDAHEGSVVTILVRGSTENIMDDVERAIDDGVNAFKCLTRSPKLVAGAGATELELARRLLTFADTLTGLEQYAVRSYARALEVTVRALAQNAGEKATEIIAMLYAKHESGEINSGIVTKSDGNVVVEDATKFSILDLHMVKHWALCFATNAACTILRVDQIIMARPAGGPKPRQPGAPDDD